MYMFKLLIIGNSSVGKTSFLFRYSDDSFTSSFARLTRKLIQYNIIIVIIDNIIDVVVRQHRRHRLQGEDRSPSQQTHQTTDLGTSVYIRPAIACELVLWFLRATAGTPIARLSHRNSVRLSVRPSVRLSHG